MIRFLKRWFATKNEVESVYSHLDIMAHAIQDIRKEQWIRDEAQRVTRELDAKKGEWNSKGLFEQTKGIQIALPAPPVKHYDRDVNAQVLYKMTQLAGTPNKFIIGVKKKKYGIRVTSADQSKLRQRSGKIEAYEYPYGAVYMWDNNSKSNCGQAVTRSYLFKTKQDYIDCVNLLKTINCSYSTGRNK